MYYLVITTSIHNKINGGSDAQKRQDRYLSAITETLKILPSEITPVIVENNGCRPTYLDHFIHGGKPVQVIYTNNNQLHFKHKGANELLDIKEVISRVGIKDDDIIFKLTGRYRVVTRDFFIETMKNNTVFDAFIKFFNCATYQFDSYDCVLGFYAMRCLYLKLWSHLSIDKYKSAEIAFAKYIRFSGAQIKEIDTLNVECVFADMDRELHV
jgi:hypothetical protein